MEKKIIDLFNYKNFQINYQIIKKKDLIPIDNLKLIFREIRDYFAGNVTGITRDETIAENFIKIIFCKIYDEKNNNNIMDFCNRLNEDPKELQARISKLFTKVKSSFPNVFNKNDTIEIFYKNLPFLISKLEKFSLLDANRDVIGDAFEELIGTSFRGGEGQFFTPRNVVKMMIEILQPNSNSLIIDPACGSGGFLAQLYLYLIKNNKKNYKIYGIDKDNFLTRLANAYLSILGEENFKVFCENSLEENKVWDENTRKNIKFGNFDIVLTNPPFGSKIPVIGANLLKQYQLGYEWEKENNIFYKSKILHHKQPPQVLFIERCIQLLKKDGKLGIVLPEGIFGNPSDRYIWEYIKEECTVLGIVSLAQETFQPSTHTKTSVLFLEKNKSKKKNVFMAIAKNIGHDKNGKPTYFFDKNGKNILNRNGEKILNDDLPKITEQFKKFLKNDSNYNTSVYGFTVNKLEIEKNNIYIPEYFNPNIKNKLSNLSKNKNYKLKSIIDLINKNIIEIKRGNEIGSKYYGSGNIPFVRTSDIVNWEIKFDPVKAVSVEVFNMFKKNQDVKENDILFVNDGTFLIGRTAMISKNDTEIVIQSHLKKIRVINNEILNPFYLFYLLNSKIVREQIDSKIFVQATISTLGNRLNEIILPILSNKNEIKNISSKVEKIFKEKTLLKEKSKKLIEESI
jgi:type I restriction enzyme M protein